MLQIVVMTALPSGSLLRGWWVTYVVGRWRLLRHGVMAQQMRLIWRRRGLDICVCSVVARSGMLERLRRVWLQERVVVTRRQSGMGMEYILMFDV